MIIKFHRIWVGYCICILITTGCVTPVAIKDASTKHTQNLVTLNKGVNAYVNNLNNYYDQLIKLQRDAYIAEKVGKDIDDVAKWQEALLKGGRSIAAVEKDGNLKSEDFINAGSRITEQFLFWGTNFDLWLERADGNSIEEKRIWFKSKESNDESERTDDDLTYISVAVNLNNQKKNFNTHIDLLLVQLKVMQEVHRKVDDYLSIDATFDGAKIAEAAMAGSNQIDPAKYPSLLDLKNSLEGGRK